MMNEAVINKSPSTILYEFLQAIVNDAAANTILNGAEVLDSAWQEMKEDKGIIVSNSEFDLAPGQSKINFFDTLLIIAFYYRIPSADTSERKDARDKCFEMAEAVAAGIYNDMSLGNRVCGCLLLRGVDGDKSTNADSYAIINLPIILNPTGTRPDYTLGEAK